MDVSNVPNEPVLHHPGEFRMPLRLLPARQRRAPFFRWDTEKASVNG